MPKAWMYYDIDTVLNLYKQGLSAKIIGQVIQRSETAVNRKLDTLGRSGLRGTVRSKMRRRVKVYATLIGDLQAQYQRARSSLPPVVAQLGTKGVTLSERAAISPQMPLTLSFDQVILMGRNLGAKIMRHPSPHLQVPMYVWRHGEDHLTITQGGILAEVNKLRLAQGLAIVHRDDD